LSSGTSIDFSSHVLADGPSFKSADISAKNLNLSKYTVDVWLYFPSSSTSGAPFSVYNSASGRILFLNFGNSGGPVVYIGPCGGSSISYQPPVNKWVNIAFSWDSANARFYVDGKYQSSVSCSPGLSSWVASNVYFGGFSSGGAHFLGLMDNAAIYTNVLTADRIQAIYAEEAPKRALAAR